jgi:hypothetical protein
MAQPPKSHGAITRFRRGGHDVYTIMEEGLGNLGLEFYCGFAMKALSFVICFPKKTK